MEFDLVGFVMGALDADEHAEVNEAIANSAELQKQVALIQSALGPLESYRYCEPPAGLADATLEYVFEQVDLHKVQPASTQSFSALTSAERVSGRSMSWRMTDFLVLSVVLLCMGMLVAPALYNSRFVAGQLACQDNLQHLYQGMNQYSLTNNGVFPSAPITNVSVSGFQAPILKAQSFVEEERFFCPTATETLAWREQGIPAVQTVVDASPEALDKLSHIGGTYGYNSGHQQEGRLLPVRNQNRSYFALVADRPTGDSIGRRSLNHDGIGQNVLFEDGHVVFLRDTKERTLGDLYFVSDRGRVEPGMHSNDAVIMESGVRLLSK
ncbi:MAG: hypothetical protein CMJ79_02880 [Planctomycetaceae bacterium]|nr:hypothetical protein [Planctomycetaceae bacterium]|tara:strand:+ start:1208 stop:2182 length:975 start_codon:yes stop_codon:yes gene_type:complete